MNTLKMPVVLAIVSWLWALPVTLIGLCLLPFYGYRSWQFVHGCLEITVKRAAGNPLGQTWGRLIYFTSTEAEVEAKQPGYFAKVRLHEHVHVLQTAVLGVFWLPLYALAFLVAGLYHSIADWTWSLSYFYMSGYTFNVFEKMARNYAGV